MKYYLYMPIYADDLILLEDDGDRWLHGVSVLRNVSMTFSSKNIKKWRCPRKEQDHSYMKGFDSIEEAIEYATLEAL